MAFTIRWANEKDAQAIKAIVRSAGINPLGIHWQRFLVAEDDTAGAGRGACRIVGIGQIKVHGDGSRELASIATVPDRQGEGIATAIIRSLLEMSASAGTGRLYLTCRGHMEHFYERFGFRRVDRLEDAPTHFRRLMRAGQLLFALARLVGNNDPGMVMVRKGD